MHLVLRPRFVSLRTAREMLHHKCLVKPRVVLPVRVAAAATAFDIRTPFKGGHQCLAFDLSPPLLHFSPREHLAPPSPRRRLPLSLRQPGTAVRSAHLPQPRATLLRATQVDPRYAQSWIQLGNSYLVTEPRDIAKADAYIRKAVALQPNEAVVHDYMGDVYRAENKLPQARAEYTRMAELAPDRGEGFQQRGHVNSFLGNFAEARADYDRAIAMSDPTLKPQYAAFRALVSVYANDPAAAESELDRIATSVDPTISNANGAKIFALTSEARIALHNRHFDVAQRAIDQVRAVYRQQAAEEGRSDTFRRNGEVNIAYWEGMLAARRGDYAATRAKAQDIMTLVAQDQSPRKNEPAHELLGLADFLQGNFQSAADHYAEANPDDVYLWYYRGLALDGAGRKEEAKEFFKRAAGWNFNGANTALVKNDARKRAR